MVDVSCLGGDTGPGKGSNRSTRTGLGRRTLASRSRTREGAKVRAVCRKQADTPEPGHGSEVGEYELVPGLPEERAR